MRKVRLRRPATQVPAPHRVSATFFEMLESRLLLSVHAVPTLNDGATPATISEIVTTGNLGAASPGIPGVPGTPADSGITPSQMYAAYDLSNPSGQGQTIAIVDPYNDPDVEQDLITFSETYDLPQMNQPGGPTFNQIDYLQGKVFPANADASWGEEISLDVEWAHAMAPQANILLVEANSSNQSDLFNAVNTARNYPGVSVVSMSWGNAESFSELSDDSHFTTPAGHIGVTFVAATGDTGSANPNYPAMSPNVVAVGGTTLNFDQAGQPDGETGWSDSGGGISEDEAQPAYQLGAGTPSSTNRTIPDVAMNAGTNASIYDSYMASPGEAWQSDGGTSLAAPMFAGIIADADQQRVANHLGTLDGATQTLPLLYSMAADNFNDITVGNNGDQAGPGYDLVTGLGSPIADLMIQALQGSVPAMKVTGDGHAIQDATATTSATNGTKLASAPMNSTAPPQSFTITNTGAVTLTFQTITLPTGFNLISAPAATLAVGSSTTFTVALDTAATGTFSGQIEIPTAQIRNPFAFAVTGIVTPALPTLGSLTAVSTTGATSVTQGSALVLTAHNVVAATPTTIRAVDFYVSTSSTFSTATAKLVGAGKHSPSGDYVLNYSTAKLPPGSYTVFARALDNLGRFGLAASATATITDDPPAIKSLQLLSPAHPAAANTVKLRALGVSDPYTSVTSVSFYWNPAGVPGAGPSALANAFFLGTATAKTGWEITATLPSASDPTHPFPTTGPVTFVAQAINARLTSSPLTTLTVQAAVQPSIGALTVTPSPINPTQPVTLTASELTDPGLAVNPTPASTGIATVQFWLAPAASTAWSPADILLGDASKRKNGNWVLNLKTFTKHPPADYVIFARALDKYGNWSNAIGQDVTVI